MYAGDRFDQSSVHNSRDRNATTVNIHTTGEYRPGRVLAYMYSYTSYDVAVTNFKITTVMYVNLCLSTFYNML